MGAGLSLHSNPRSSIRVGGYEDHTSGFQSPLYLIERSRLHIPSSGLEPLDRGGGDVRCCSEFSHSQTNGRPGQLDLKRYNSRHSVLLCEYTVLTLSGRCDHIRAPCAEMLADAARSRVDWRLPRSRACLPTGTKYPG
jgi:hypothetical protein